MLEFWEVPRLQQGYTTFETSKVTTFAALPIGTAIGSPTRSCCRRLRTVCEHKSSVQRTRLNPQTLKAKREPFATHSGKKIDSTGVIGEGCCKQAVNKFPHAIKQDLRNVSESWAVAKLVWQTSWKHPTGYGTAWFQPIFGKSLGVVHWLVVCAL